MTMDNDALFDEADELHDEGDFAAAFALFSKGAEDGDTSCMLRLALMYSNGEGVELDLDKTEEWELKAVEAGEPLAMLNLAMTCRINGDMRASKAWLEKALKAGFDEAALELAKLYMVSDKETAQVIYYLEIALAGDSMSEDDMEEADALLQEMKVA